MNLMEGYAMAEDKYMSVVDLPEDDFTLCRYIGEYYGLPDLSAVVHWLLRDKLLEMANTIDYQRLHGIITSRNNHSEGMRRISDEH